MFLQLKVPMADKPGTTVNFRKLLLNRCQKEFERDKMDDAVFERKQKELDCATSVRVENEGLPLALFTPGHVFLTWGCILIRF